MYLVCIVWHVQVFITIWLVPWRDMCYTWHDMTCISHDMVWHLLIRAWQANWSLFFFGIHDYFFVCLETQYTCNILIQNCFLFSRQLCLLLNAEDIYRAMSEILLQEEDFQFASLMVRYLNMILLTSSELFDLRDQLRELATAVRKLQLILFQLVSSCSRVMFL